MIHKNSTILSKFRLKNCCNFGDLLFFDTRINLICEQCGGLASKLFIFICAGWQFIRGQQHSEVDANKNNRPLMRITNET